VSLFTKTYACYIVLINLVLESADHGNGKNSTGFCTGKPFLNLLTQTFAVTHGRNQAQHLIPTHPVYGVQDWDAAPGAIDWPLLTSFLRRVKATGNIPPDHRSHDHLNEQKEVPVDKALQEKWEAAFAKFKAQQNSKGTKIVWGLVDGFLLYWHPVRVGRNEIIIINSFRKRVVGITDLF
jgi:nicotinamide/nicotinate riboside kinase